MQVSLISGTASSSLHQEGVPNCPTLVALARPLNPQWLAWSQVPFSLSLHPCPQACGSLPIYAGVLGCAWGNGPIHLGDVSDGDLGFWTLPDLLIALGNRPGVKLLECRSPPTIGPRPALATGPHVLHWLLPPVSGYVTFLWTPNSAYPSHSVKHLAVSIIFWLGCPVQSSPIRLGRGLSPCLKWAKLQFHQGVPT